MRPPVNPRRPATRWPRRWTGSWWPEPADSTRSRGRPCWPPQAGSAWPTWRRCYASGRQTSRRRPPPGPGRSTRSTRRAMRRPSASPTVSAAIPSLRCGWPRGASRSPGCRRRRSCPTSCRPAAVPTWPSDSRPSTYWPGSRCRRPSRRSPRSPRNSATARSIPRSRWRWARRRPRRGSTRRPSPANRPVRSPPGAIRSWGATPRAAGRSSSRRKRCRASAATRRKAAAAATGPDQASRASAAATSSTIRSTGSAADTTMGRSSGPGSSSVAS